MRKRATARREPSSTASEESTAATIALRSPGVVRHSPHHPWSRWVWSMPTRSAIRRTSSRPTSASSASVATLSLRVIIRSARERWRALSFLPCSWRWCSRRRQDQHLDRAVAVALLRVEAEGLAAAQVDQLQAEVAAAAVEVVVEPLGELRRLDPLDRGRCGRVWLWVGEAEGGGGCRGRRGCRSAGRGLGCRGLRRGGPVTGAPREHGQTGRCAAAGEQPVAVEGPLRHRDRVRSQPARSRITAQRRSSTGGPWWSQVARTSSSTVTAADPGPRPRPQRASRAPSRRAPPGSGCGPRRRRRSSRRSPRRPVEPGHRVPDDGENTVVDRVGETLGDPARRGCLVDDHRVRPGHHEGGGQARVAVELPGPDERGQVRPARIGRRVHRGHVAPPPVDDLDLLGHEPVRPDPSTTSGDAVGPVDQPSPTNR